MPSKKTTLRITERDLHLLSDLGDYRFLSADQISALHFPSEGTARSRLQALHGAGLCARVFMPARPYDRKVTTIYALARRGARLLPARDTGPPPRALTDRDRRSALFLDHTLRRNDVRICLELLHRDQPGFALLSWKQRVDEVALSARLPMPSGEYRKIPVVPDGFFAARVNGTIHGFCLEVDMGTVSRTRMADRYRAYHALWRDGALARRFGSVPLRVLTMTTTLARQEALRRLAATSSPTRRASGLFWFAQLARADIHAPASLIDDAWTASFPAEATTRPLFD